MTIEKRSYSHIVLSVKIFIVCFLIIIKTCPAYAEDNQTDYEVKERNQVIEFPIGANYYIVNGNRVNTYAPAYITAEGVIMIPLRKACGLYGIKDEQIVWYNPAKSVKIIGDDGRFIKFAVGKSEYLFGNSERVSGFEGSAQIKMLDGQAVLYVPFITFGHAFGLAMSWNEETNTAMFNGDYETSENPFEGLGTPPLLGGMSIDWIGFIVYNGKTYRQAEYIECDEAAKEAFIGKYIGAPAEYDIWSRDRDYTKEFIATVTGDVYTVSGYDEKFRICVPEMYEGCEFIAFFESLDGISLSKGKDLYGDLLHLKENYTEVSYQLNDDWNNGKDNYKQFKSFTKSDYDEFFDAIYNAGFDELSTDEINALYNASVIKRSHLYIKMKDNTTVKLILYENGYVDYISGYYRKTGSLYLNMNNDLFYKFFEASLE